MARRRLLAPVPPQDLTSLASKPKPGQSYLTAAAKRITAKDLSKRYEKVNKQAWQDDAWDMFDLVGEHRYLITNLAHKTSQARLFVGKKPEDDTEEPEPIEDGPAFDVWETFTDNCDLASLVYRFKANIGVAGDGYLIGIPQDQNGEEIDDTTEAASPTDYLTPIGSKNEELAVQDLRWAFYSVSEVSISQDEIRITQDNGKPKAYKPTTIWLVRIWRMHPRRSWQADSPTRSALPVLREIAGLTMMTGAQIDSRLAGAGVFLVPQEAAAALNSMSGLGEESDDDPFTDALIEAMITPINDRSNASSVVPLVLKVPGETINNFKHISFATPLDAKADEKLKSCLIRLAGSMDAPPELMTGVSKTNHWGAWLVSEDTVRTHVEPDLALLCDALSCEFLWPTLIAGGMSEEEAQDYVVWYDVEHMIIRTGMSQGATDLYDKNVISPKALRNVNGFDETDAPEVETDTAKAALEMAIRMVSDNPTLLASPGIPSIVDQIKRVLDGYIGPTPVEDLGAPKSGGPTGAAGEAAIEGGQGVPSSTSEGPSGYALVASAIAQLGKAPDVHIQLPEGFVSHTVENRIELPQVKAPDINVKVEPTPVIVHNEVPVPSVEVAAPNVVVTNRVETPKVEVQAPTVHVAPPKVDVHVPEQKQRKVRKKVIRDDNGNIVGMEETS